MRGVSCALLGVAAALVASPSSAAASLGFRDILPVGQGQSVNATELATFEAAGTIPATFTNQLSMFNRLLTDASHLTRADVLNDFKDASIRLVPGTGTAETPPLPGVTILRDAYNVPHVHGDTLAHTLAGAGYVQAEDRLFEMDILRHLGRADLAEFLGPSFLPMDKAVWLQSDYDEAELQHQLDQLPVLYGAAGRRALDEEQAYVDGINAYISRVRADPLELPGEYAAIHALPAPWTEADSVAIAAEINQGFDLGGGGQVADAGLLQALHTRLGGRAGGAAYADVRALEDPAAPTTTRQRFPFDNPGRANSRALAMPARGSVQPIDPVVNGSGGAADPAPGAAINAAALLRSHLGRPSGESYAFLIGAGRSSSHHPVADMGPQLDFFSPELLDEEALDGPGISVDGGALPGALPVPIAGHTPKFAWSVTIGVGDHIDIFAERLCNPDGSAPTRSASHYLYKGRCVPFLIRDRQESTSPNGLDTSPPESFVLRTVRSVHGPVQSFGTVGGHPVAFARGDATYFHLADTGLVYDQLLDGTVHSPQSFITTVRRAPFSLNWFYLDARHIAWTLSGSYPRRARGTSSDIPTWGTGPWDWRGFNPSAYTSAMITGAAIPHDMDPARGYIANWNNKPAPGWRAASDDFYYSSAHRVQLVSSRIDRALAHRGKLDPVRLAALVEDADTADMRGETVLPLALRIIGRGSDASTRGLVSLLRAWVAGGAHRRDLSGSGSYQHSAAVALMDAWWPQMVPAIFQPVLGREAYRDAVGISALDDPPNLDAEAWYNGWYGQVAQDLRDVLSPRGGSPRLRPLGSFSRVYCGGTARRSGSLGACRRALLASLRAAAAQVARRFGSSDSASWKVPVTCPVPSSGPPPCDEIVFSALGAVTTPPVPWQNRPTFQQLVEIGG